MLDLESTLLQFMALMREHPATCTEDSCVQGAGEQDSVPGSRHPVVNTHVSPDFCSQNYKYTGLWAKLCCWWCFFKKYL